MSLSEFCIYSPFFFGERKKTNKPAKGLSQRKIKYHEVLIFSFKNISCGYCLPRWTNVSRSEEISCWCQAKNCQLQQNVREFQITSICKILHFTSYGKSMHKTVLRYLHILQNFFLYLTAFIVEFVCRWLNFTANATWHWKLDSAALSEWAPVSVDQTPPPQTSQWFSFFPHPKVCFVQFIRKFWDTPSSPACPAASVLAALDLHSSERRYESLYAQIQRKYEFSCS